MLWSLAGLSRSGGRAGGSSQCSREPASSENNPCLRGTGGCPGAAWLLEPSSLLRAAPAHPPLAGRARSRGDGPPLECPWLRGSLLQLRPLCLVTSRNEGSFPSAAGLCQAQLSPRPLLPGGRRWMSWSQDSPRTPPGEVASCAGLNSGELKKHPMTLCCRGLGGCLQRTPPLSWGGGSWQGDPLSPGGCDSVDRYQKLVSCRLETLYGTSIRRAELEARLQYLKVRP